MFKRLLLALLLFGGPAFAASPELCQDIAANSTDKVASFSFAGCPLVFGDASKKAYTTFYGDAATTSSTPVAAGAVVGVCVKQTKVVHVIMSGSDTGTVRVCNYGGTP
jgi:hypothetical protein